MPTLSLITDKEFYYLTGNRWKLMGNCGQTERFLVCCRRWLDCLRRSSRMCRDREMGMKVF